MAGIKIGTNILSLNAQRMLAESSYKLSQSLERLSSGMRINRASDDAAGLAIATDLNARARQYTQSIRNVSDAQSVTSIMTGAISSLVQITQRGQELAEQAMNGTLDYKKRKALNQEMQALAKEFNRITETTKFNGIILFAPDTNDLQIQAGSTNTQFALSVDAGALDTSKENNGNFTLSQSSLNSPRLGVLADINNDGILDQITKYNGTGQSHINIYIGNANGTFKAGYTQSNLFDTGSTYSNINSGDFNGDGNMDLIVTGPSAGYNLLWGNGDGSFQAPITDALSTAQIGGVVVADLNDDGRDDIIMHGNGGTDVWLGNADRTFKYQGRASTAGGAFVYNYDLGDINGDGKLDLTWLSGGSATDVYYALGNGNGTFQATQTLVGGSAINVNTSATYFDDVNGDGFDDLLVSEGVVRVNVFLSRGDGTFGSIVTNTITNGIQGSPSRGGGADLNGDGRSDFLGGTGQLWVSNGDGTFSAAATIRSGGFGGADVLFADLNSDGAIDFSANDIYIAQGNASSKLQELDLTTVLKSKNSFNILATVMDKLNQKLSIIGANESRLYIAGNHLSSLRINYAGAASAITDLNIAEETATLAKSRILQDVGAAILAQANKEPELVLQLLRD